MTEGDAGIGTHDGLAVHSKVMHADSRRRPVGVACLSVTAVLLICVPCTHALSERGHAFGGSFGAAAGLSRPSAVAVNEARGGEGAGDAYVLDSANNRVVRFGPAPAHTFLEAWGYGVSDGAKAFEKCTSSCRPGLAGFAKGQFSDPVAIAIDNATGSPSHGDVYIVANPTAVKAVIDKFSPSGTLLGRLISKKEEKEEVEGMIDGVAVDGSGNVWVEREDETEEFLLERFSNQPNNKILGEPAEVEVPVNEGPRPVRPGFAVDSEGDIYITYEPGGEDLEERAAHAQGLCERNACLVAKLALVPGLGGSVEALPLNSELDGENSTGVAVDLSSGKQSSDNVYLDNATSIAAFTRGGSPIQRFGSEQLQQSGGLTVDSQTNEVLVTDTGAGVVDVYASSPPGPPLIAAGSVSATKVTPRSAELRATIDPSGADTHYRFQYGAVACTTTPSPCSEAPPAPGSDIGQGFGDQSASAQIGGLSPSTTYHVRVVAENRFAEGSAAMLSEERTFTTEAPALGPALPDGRAWELVSPADKHGATVEPIQREGGLIQAANDGHSITYTTSAPVGENEPQGNRAPEQPQIFSTRGAGGWSSLSITTPNEVARGVRLGLPREYEWFSADLGLGLVEPPSAVPLSTPPQQETIYVRHNLTCAAAPASCFEPVVTSANDTAASRFGGALAFKAATPDLTHVVFASSVPLTAGASGAGLYEWSATDGQLQLLSVPPAGSPPVETASLGGNSPTEMASSAISEDGARVVWRANPSGAGHLYMRETAKGQTVQVDEPNTGAPAAKLASAPDFRTGSADGSKVFFGDPQRLTADSTAPEIHPLNPPADLYVFEPEKPAGERLTDLTPDLNAGEGAGLQGEVAASSDGSFVYFVANGVLAEGAQPGNCREEAPSGAACSLYVAHYDGHGWGKPRFIARLSGEDAPDWGRPGGGFYKLKAMTSRASPDGHYLAFMSNRPLTGYDNVDEKSGIRDEEVFLYSYGAGESGHLVCASCNPSGARPAGVLDTEESGEGLGLVVDRPEVWTEGIEGVDHWLAAAVPGWTDMSLLESLYQSRYLLNDGRLFFNSSDALVPRAVNKGKMDVYEYEPTGVGGCQVENTEGGCVALISSGESQHESAFLDASESGNDVFFITNAKLSPQDVDTNYDIYDARVCEAPGAEACVSPGSGPPPPCSSEACKRAPSMPAASSGAPASSMYSGSGNLVQQRTLPTNSVQGSKTVHKPLTRAQKLAAALKSCRKKFKRGKKRVACEKQARNKYGAKASKAKRISGGAAASRASG
jgi:hypothetical protein